MKFAAKKDYGPLYCLGGTLLIGVVAVLLARLALHSNVGPVVFILLLLVLDLVFLAIFALVYTVGFALLNYQIDRNGLIVSLGLFHLTVPISAISAINTAPETANNYRLNGLRFRGHNVGVQSTSWGKSIVFVATAPAAECLYIAAGTHIYAISPADKTAFLEQYNGSRSLGALRILPETSYLNFSLRNLLWRDKLGMCLAGAALVLGLLVLAMAFWRYPSLPESIPMHFDTLGRPDFLAPRQRLFYLPLIGSITIAMNFILAILLYYKERLLSYFLWGGAALVQILLYIALRTITG